MIGFASGNLKLLTSQSFLNSDGLNNERYHKRINIKKKKKKTKKKNKKKKKKKIAQGKDKPAGGLIIAGLQGGCKDF